MADWVKTAYYYNRVCHKQDYGILVWNIFDSLAFVFFRSVRLQHFEDSDTFKACWVILVFPQSTELTLTKGSFIVRIVVFLRVYMYTRMTSGCTAFSEGRLDWRNLEAVALRPAST